VTESVVEGVKRQIPWIAQVPLRHDPELARRGERAALLAVNLVAVIAVQNDVPFELARQLDAIQEHITRAVTARAGIVIACSFPPIAITIAGCPLPTERAKHHVHATFRP